jgi:hypothetical protein
LFEGASRIFWDAILFRIAFFVGLLPLHPVSRVKGDALLMRHANPLSLSLIFGRRLAFTGGRSKYRQEHDYRQ